MVKQGKKRTDGRKPQAVNGVDLKPSGYQPSKKELEADIRVPVPSDRLVDAVFANDRPEQAANP